MTTFNNISDIEKLLQTPYFFVIKDRYPVAPGHCLIISNEVRADFFALMGKEKAELATVIDKVKLLIEAEHKPDGYNIGMNCGEAAGQTVFHFHCHVIPRYTGDMSDPRGGIRHCIKGKGYY